jgi:hypothetical protein
VVGQGWFVWTRIGLREALRQGQEIEQRLIERLQRLDRILLANAKLRWGIWVDQYLVRFGHQGTPAIGHVTARAIFNFEPDSALCSSEAVYLVNRRYEQFVCSSHRLLSGEDQIGYRVLGRKRPSALDHVERHDTTEFIGRGYALSAIGRWWKQAGRTKTLAVIGSAGSGKTRLIREWLSKHPKVRSLTATFSLFGGDVQSLAIQLAELPSDCFDHQIMVDAAAKRIRLDKIDVLVIDDIHWAEEAGLAFVQLLLETLSKSKTFVILASRSIGRTRVRALRPAHELVLRRLAASTVEKLAHRLIASKAAARTAALRSKGNLLFVEQFAAWVVETGAGRDTDGPRNLYEVITARIECLSEVRLGAIRERLRWGRSWERQAVHDDLRQLEIEIGLWLDRLETGDYADRVEAARLLAKLERLDYEIFIVDALAGLPRVRSSRLREAIDRLLAGSADQILKDLKGRLAKASSADKQNIVGEAQRSGDVLFAAWNWSAAANFYELALSVAPAYETREIAAQLEQCHRRSREVITDARQIYGPCGRASVDEEPSVNSLDLPYIWSELGYRYSDTAYFLRAAEAAETVHDNAMARWARGMAKTKTGNKAIFPIE